MKNLFLGETLGSWIQWVGSIIITLVGIIVTITALIITIRHYSNDHRFHLYYRIWFNVKNNNKDGSVSPIDGQTIYVINMGPAVAKIKFWGITRDVSNLTMWYLNKRIKIYDKHPFIRSFMKHYPLKYDKRQLNMDHFIDEMFGKDDFKLLRDVEDECKEEFRSGELIETLVELLKHNLKLKKKVINGADIKYDYTFITFDGKLYRQRMILRSKNQIYSAVIQKLKSVQNVSN